MGAGLDRFEAELMQLGINAEQRDSLLVYNVVPTSGTSGGLETETGVEVPALDTWPQVPPHWIHAPNSLVIPGSNQQASSLAGWSRYSRPHPGRLDASAAPMREWIAHVRAVLGESA